MADPALNAIRKFPTINWIFETVKKYIELRGQASTGKKYRGLRHTDQSDNQKRPSLCANWKRRNQVKLIRYRQA